MSSHHDSADELHLMTVDEHQRRIGIALEARSTFRKAFARSAYASATVELKERPASGSIARQLREWAKPVGGSWNLVMWFAALDPATQQTSLTEMRHAAGIFPIRSSDWCTNLAPVFDFPDGEALIARHSGLPLQRPPPSSNATAAISPRTAYVMEAVTEASKPRPTAAIRAATASLESVQCRRELALREHRQASALRDTRRALWGIEEEEKMARAALWTSETVRSADGIGAVRILAVAAHEHLHRLAVLREELDAAFGIWMFGIRDLHSRAWLAMVDHAADALRRDEAVSRCNIVVEERSFFVELTARCRRGIPLEELRWRLRQNELEQDEVRRKLECRAQLELDELRRHQIEWLEKQRVQLAKLKSRVATRRREQHSREQHNREQHSDDALMVRVEEVERARHQAAAYLERFTLQVDFLDTLFAMAADDALFRSAVALSAVRRLDHETHRRVESHLAEDHALDVFAASEAVSRNRHQTYELRLKQKQLLEDRAVRRANPAVQRTVDSSAAE